MSGSKKDKDNDFAADKRKSGTREMYSDHGQKQSGVKRGGVTFTSGDGSDDDGFDFNESNFETMKSKHVMK